MARRTSSDGQGESQGQNLRSADGRATHTNGGSSRRLDHPRVCLNVNDEVLRLALRQVAADGELTLVENPARATYVVSDAAYPAAESSDILVVDPSPLEASVGLGAVQAGVAQAVLSRRRPESLLAAVESLDHELAPVETAIFAAARDLPRLTSRQHELLLAIGGDRVADNSSLARRLNLSISTVKRTISEVSSALGVEDRYGLQEKARQLGYGGDVPKPAIDMLIGLSSGSFARDVRPSASPADGTSLLLDAVEQL